MLVSPPAVEVAGGTSVTVRSWAGGSISLVIGDAAPARQLGDYAIPADEMRRPRRKKGGPSKRELLAGLAAASDPLSYLSLTPRQTEGGSGGCVPVPMVVRCDCTWRKVESSCMNADCPSCAEAVGQRRAARVFDRLVAGKPSPLWPVLYTVLTVPVQLHPLVCQPKVWAALRRAAWRMLRRHFRATFGLEATHPVGDKGERLHGKVGESSDESVFHPHFNFLWVRVGDWSGYVNYDQLRAEWRKVLVAMAAARGFAVDWSTVPTVQAHHGEANSDAKLRHKCRYVTRVFLGWSWWAGSMRWFGKFPKMTQEPCKCRDCGGLFRIVASGPLVDVVIARFLAAGVAEGIPLPRGVPPPWSTDGARNAPPAKGETC